MLTFNCYCVFGLQKNLMMNKFLLLKQRNLSAIENDFVFIKLYIYILPLDS